MHKLICKAGACLCCLLLLFGLGGCGPTKAKIKGKLTKAGQPLQVNDKTQVTLTFAPEIADAKQTTYPATFKPADGTFEVVVPAGKYKANLVIFDHARNVMVPVSPEFRKTVYDLAEDKVIDIDIPK